MKNEEVRRLDFANASIEGIVTVVGDKEVEFLASAAETGLTSMEAKRLAKVMGLGTRYVCSGDQTTADLCVDAAKKLLVGTSTNPADVGGVIFVSQSPDYAAPATAISIQDRLGIPVNTICLDVRLGCSGFVYGLSVAFGLIEGGADNLLLCVGDVASKLIDPHDHTVAPIMGDAGSAVLIRRKPSQSTFFLYSDGSGFDSLIIPNSGVRRDPRFTGHAPLMKMDGKSVFDFSLKRVPPLIETALDQLGITQEDLDYFVLHQPNKYMLQNIKKRLSLPDDKVPSSTQAVYGNQNSASIPGTINGFLAENFSSKRLRSMFVGFGIGLSWGCGVVETDSIFAPKPFFSKVRGG